MDEDLFAPIFTTDNIGVTKLTHDRYEVYVNGNYVGNKVLLNELDKLTDIDRRLHNEGFHGFKTEENGDHYEITVKDSRLADDIRRHLKIYLGLH